MVRCAATDHVGVESMRQKNSVTKVEQKPGAAMSRIVQCPKCRVLLQEPPPGNPYYQCGSCSTTLQAKHATKADLESTNIRFNPVDKSNSRSSKSDSSSGEISERVGDDFAYAGGDGHRPWSPIRKDATPSYPRPRGGAAAGAGAPPPAPEHFRPSSDNARHNSAEKQQPDQVGGGVVAAGAGPRAGYNTMATKHPQPSQQIVNYMVSMNSSEVDMTLLANESASGADYISRRREPRSSPSPQEPSPAYGSSGFNRHPQMQAPRINSVTRLNGGRADADNEAARPQVGSNSIVTGGGGGGEMLSLQRQQSGASSELQRQHSGPASDQLQRQHSGPSAEQVALAQSMQNSQSLNQGGGGGAGESSSSSNLSSSRSSSGRAPKLKWQPRPEPVENPVPSPKAVEVVISSGSGSRGKFEDDRIASGISHEDRVKETTSVEYVTERNWRELSSRRRGKEDQHIQRTHSDGSEKNFDMYDNSTYAGPDYEASETSSTMDEGEGSEASGGPNMGRLSPPPPLQLPDIRGGASRSQSRPNLPRSRVPGYSEEGNPHTSKMPTELDSMDNAHPHSDKVNRLNRRQHSWDATRMGASSSSSNINSPVPASETSTGLRKSSSDDYVSMVKEIEHLHSRGSSDPGVVYQQTQQVDASQTQQQQQQQHHHQWVARLKHQSSLPRSNASISSPKGSPGAVGGGGGGVSSPRPPTHVQWSQSGSNLSPYPVETNPLPPSQFASHQAPQPPNQSSRQMPDSLPPKREGNYPPLPLPGALPHVECQHCHTILAVPVNLPPPKKSTQKLRCGACMKISTFAVPQPVDSTPAAARPEVQFGQSLFASSPDGQMDAGYRTTSGRSLSATSDDLRRSGRRFSDLSDKSLPITRNNSIGSADMPSDEELADRVRSLKIDSFSNPVISTSSDAVIPSSYSDVSPSNPDYRSRFSRGSPGPLYPKRGSLEHSGSGGRHQTEERSRFGGDPKGPGLRGRHHEEGVVTSSDDENDSLHRNLANVGSPSMDGGHRHTHSSSRSPPPHPHSPPMFDPRTPPSGHGIGDHSVKEQQAHEQPKGFNKALKGFIHIKTSLRELTHKGRGASANQTRSRVTVNGESIPDHVIKKAEEQAGHISPGNYWYDALAGFWGAAGGQCEGIIPTQIEEFHHPMSRNCAGGTTNVLVNGRELHSRDLEILAKRGLPIIPGRSYRIDIGGRVINEATGEELRGLGPLAPTMVQKGRGNGMFMQTR